MTTTPAQGNIFIVEMAGPSSKRYADVILKSDATCRRWRKASMTPSWTVGFQPPRSARLHLSDPDRGHKRLIPTATARRTQAEIGSYRRWSARGRSWHLFLAAFRPLFWLNRSWSAPIPFGPLTPPSGER